MGLRAAVAGASGYAGGELLRLLLGHPQIELAALTAGSSAGAEVTATPPQLPQLAGRTFVATDAAALADADVAFLALPQGESAALAARLPDELTVIDLGADFRLADAAAWDRYYGGPHAGCWPYGLPELPGARAVLAGARRIANPGCYPTAVALALAPLLAPMPRGILATCTARLRPGVDEAAVRAAIAAAYGDEPFVHLLPAGRWPHTAATAGSNAAQLQVTADVTAGRAVVVAAIDNLGKGQAVQCANLALGLPETAGLTAAGIAP